MIQALRQPPMSSEAEQSVLGGLMLDNASLVRVVDWLAEDDFYRRDHRMIYRGIRELAGAGKPFDSVTLGEWFEVNGLAEQIGGTGYLVELASTTPSAANLTAYAEIVAEKSRLRSGIELGTALANDCFESAGRSAADILAAAHSGLLALSPTRQTGLLPAKAGLQSMFQALCARWEDQALPGLPTPWAEVNTVTNGLQDAELIVLAARSNMGKSLLAFQLASFNALRGNRTAVFSLEQTAEAVMRRCVACLGEVPHHWLRQPSSEHDHWAATNAAMKQLVVAPLWIDDSPRLTATQIRARAMREHLRKPLRLIVVDHLHEMGLPGKQGETIERGDAMRDLRAMAKDIGCPVVVLAQLNRGADDDGARPRLKHLRGSGGIEEVADIVLFAHRPEYYNPGDNPGLLELIVGKGRDIESGKTIHLKWRGEFMRADDWTGDKPSIPQSVTKRTRDRWGDVAA